MALPPYPPDEEARLKELEGLHILDTPAEERFDRITRLAMSLFDVPITLISLVDGKRVWFKSSQGLAASEVPREISFCSHAILTSETLVVQDASRDIRFQDNPLVTGEANIQFYAGHPLMGPNGHRLGVLCLLDHKPREFGDKELQNLRDLAVLAEAELGVAQITQTHQKLLRETGKLRDQALVDSLTRLWNRGAIFEILELEWARAQKSGAPVGVIMADLDEFKKINDTLGHPTGDAVLLKTAQLLRTCLRDSDAAGRYGGEEFLVVLPGAELDIAMKVAERIRSTVEKCIMVLPEGPVSITLSMGVGVIPKDQGVSLDSFISKIDKALYKAKNDGRDCVRAIPAE